MTSHSEFLPKDTVDMAREFMLGVFLINFLMWGGFVVVVMNSEKSMGVLASIALVMLTLANFLGWFFAWRMK